MHQRRHNPSMHTITNNETTEREDSLEAELELHSEPAITTWLPASSR